MYPRPAQETPERNYLLLRLLPLREFPLLAGTGDAGGVSPAAPAAPSVRRYGLKNRSASSAVVMASAVMCPEVLLVSLPRRMTSLRGQRKHILLSFVNHCFD